MAANRRVCCCSKPLPLCYVKGSIELSRRLTLKSHWSFQSPLCTGIWFDFNVKCYKLCHQPKLVGEPLMLELNRTFPQKRGTEFIVLGKWLTSVAVDNFGVVGKNIYKKTTLFSRNFSVNSFYSNIGTLLHSVQITLQLFPMRLLRQK